MYLAARLMGVSSYAISLLIIVYLIGRVHPRIAVRLTWVYYIILLLMAAFFVPDVSADLSRYINNMHFYVSASKETIEKALLKTSTPGAVLLLYGIGIFHNDRLLPLFAAAVDFLLIFSILRCEIKNFNAHGNQISMALLVLMSPGILMSVISGIRNMMVYSIIIYCIYGEFLLNKKFFKNLPLYIIAASIHVMGQVILLYRIIFSIFENENKKHRIIKILTSILLLFIIYKKGQGYTDLLIEKGERYYSSSLDGTGYFYVWNLVLSIIKLTIVTFLVFEYYKLERDLRKRNYTTRYGVETYAKFIVPIMAMAPILMFVEYTFFVRTCGLLHLLSFPLVILTIDRSRQMNKERKVVRTLLILSLIMLFISCARGDICSLKFFI